MGYSDELTDRDLAILWYYVRGLSMAEIGKQESIILEHEITATQVKRLMTRAIHRVLREYTILKRENRDLKMDAGWLGVE